MPRRRRQLNKAVLHHQRLHRDLVAGRLQIDEELGDPEVRNHRGKLHRRGRPDECRVIVVGRHRHGMRLRHSGNVKHRADSATIADVRIDDIRGTRRQRLGERLLRVDRLTRDDRHARQRTPHLRHQLDVVAQARLLVPANVELGETFADTDRMHRREPAMHFDQQPKLGPQGLTHLPHVPHNVVFVLAMDKIAPGSWERVPFQRGEAHLLHLQRALQVLFDGLAAARPAIGIDLHPLARCATQQVVQRQLRVLGHDVPQCDLDRAPCRQQVERRAPHRIVVEHHLRGVADVERAAPDHVFRHDLQQVLDHRLLSRRDIGFAPAVDAFLGLHTAEQQVLRQSGIEQERLYSGNLQLWHRFPPRRMVAVDITGGKAREEAACSSTRSPMKSPVRPPSSR